MIHRFYRYSRDLLIPILWNDVIEIFKYQFRISEPKPILSRVEIKFPLGGVGEIKNRVKKITLDNSFDSLSHYFESTQKLYNTTYMIKNEHIKFG